MPKSKSSKEWLAAHNRDVYVRRSRDLGFRSRASFKLLEIHQKDSLLRPGMCVIDLGAAPGGWSQVAAQYVGDQGHVLACDLLAMDPIPGVEFIQGDFTVSTVFDRVVNTLGESRADLVISDMAPNISGIRDCDQAKAISLAEAALELAEAVLVGGGGFLVKVFQGDGFDDYRRVLVARFGRVVVRKPDSSRDRSREVYLLARNFVGKGRR